MTIKTRLSRFQFGGVFLASAVLGACATTPDSSSSATGTTRSSDADDFSLPDTSGRTVAISDHQGKVVLAIFFATWCVPCATEMEQAEKIYQELKDQGFVVLAISTDGPTSEGQLPGFIAQHGIRYPVLQDRESRVFERYQPKGVLPFWLLFDRQGRVHKKHEGYSPGSEVEIERAVRDLL